MDRGVSVDRASRRGRFRRSLRSTGLRDSIVGLSDKECPAQVAGAEDELAIGAPSSSTRWSATPTLLRIFHRLPQAKACNLDVHRKIVDVLARRDADADTAAE